MPEENANNQANSIKIPLWKQVIVLIFLLLVGYGIYESFNGHFVEVLSVFTGFIFSIGLVLVFVFLISKELFFWLIGKKSEYQKMYKAYNNVSTNSANLLIDRLPSDLKKSEKEKLKEDVPTVVDFTLTSSINSYIVRAFTGLFATAFALLGTIVLMNQNERIDTQNELIKKQNTRLDQQTYLQEAERRSSLVFLFSNIMDAIDQELKTDVGIKGKPDLSPQLTGRIIALSTRLKPYNYMDGDTLIDKPLSPERGQLLVSLIGSELDSVSLIQIFERADFSYADLERANLSGAMMNGINLEKANLKRAILHDAKMKNSNLSKAELQNAELLRASLQNAILKKTNFNKAHLGYIKRVEDFLVNGVNISPMNDKTSNIKGANLSNADLSGADFSNASLFNAILKNIEFNKETTFKNSKMWNTTFTGSDLRGINLTDVNMTLSELDSTKLKGAILTKVDLRGANLSDSDISNATLNDVDLSDLPGNKKTPDFRYTKLDRVVINDTDWLNKVNINLEEISKRYNIKKASELDSKREPVEKYIFMPK